MRSSLVIVSNRLPISVKKVDGKLSFYPSVGGLATGLSSYVDDKNNKWIGWPGIPSDDLTEAEQNKIARVLKRSNCYPVFFKQKQLDDYYNGYSNSILWPVFHDLEVRADMAAQHEKYWRAYRTVNTTFADKVLALSDPGSTIWVHDYQLLLLPSLLRAARPKARIGFFLHIPFPGLKHFEQIPSGKQLLYGMLGADLLGLHTKSYVDNFLDVASDITGDVVTPGEVMQAGHVTHVKDFPMGIDYARFTKARELSTVKKELKRHQRKYKGMKVILTVDRLDPTKGLAERLEAYHEFLRRTPSLHRKVVMAMLAVPSRTEIDEYKKLKERVEGLVETINREFGSSKWQPVDYMPKAIPVEAVTALYQVADIAFITPLRDGMNLVAKEYIASKPKGDGVLILSSTAGAAQELTDALLVNPRRLESLVGALTTAVKMPKRELKHRVDTMHRQISTHTVQRWSKTFMKTLQQPVPGTRHQTRTLTAERQQSLADAFRAAKHPVLLFDYDGVLTPIVARPDDAMPSKELLATLKKLTSPAQTRAAIISGRSQHDLEKWLGKLPLSLVAEHGALVRFSNPISGRKTAAKGLVKPSHATWERMTTVAPTWQDDALPILEKYASITPGSHVEIKNFSLVWHYRTASTYYAQKHLVSLRRLLKPLAKAHDLGIYSGKKILEIKPRDINKGVAAQECLKHFSATSGAPDFILCIGDDYTDEDMFEALPDSAYTLKVGRGVTAARYRVSSPNDVNKLLLSL